MANAVRGNGASGGTRFRVFPRPPFVHPDWTPELISISTPAGAVQPGPSDDRMYVINPIGKLHAYGVIAGPFGTRYLNLPPWQGPIKPPVQPASDGHFDNIAAYRPEFLAAHAFAAIRFALDRWEGYFGRRIEWHFRDDFDRLEVVMLPELDNARAGYGYIEVGADHSESGMLLPFALDFDVLAHELGHLIIYSTVGVPDLSVEDGEYFGFHESAADLTALVAAANFDSLLERLLEETHGNLFSYNELDRFAELSATTQIRLASNSVTMSRFAAGWTDEHELSQPLTGAVFDIFVDVFQENLVEQGVIDRRIADLADHVAHEPSYASLIQTAFDNAYPAARDAFRGALVGARDYLGAALADTWRHLSPDDLRYSDVGLALLDADQRLKGGRYRNEILESFEWRGIGRIAVGPRIGPQNYGGHSFSARTVVPKANCSSSHLSRRERLMFPRR